MFQACVRLVLPEAFGGEKPKNRVIITMGTNMGTSLLGVNTHIYIYIYMVPPPPQDPYFLRIYWYLRYFVVFYYV